MSSHIASADAIKAKIEEAHQNADNSLQKPTSSRIVIVSSEEEYKRQAKFLVSYVHEMTQEFMQYCKPVIKPPQKRVSFSLYSDDDAKEYDGETAVQQKKKIKPKHGYQPIK